jgi:hypothetical protein
MVLQDSAVPYGCGMVVQWQHLVGGRAGAGGGGEAGDDQGGHQDPYWQVHQLSTSAEKL